MSSIGRRLRELRAGRTQGQVAAELGVSTALVSAWENAHLVPPEARLAGMAALFGVSINELMDLRRHSLVEADMAQGGPEGDLLLVLVDIREMLREIRDNLARWEGPGA